MITIILVLTDLRKKIWILFIETGIIMGKILKDFEKKDINFGNWDSIINKFDTYKDGKTNIRIMSFINKFLK